MKLFCVSTITLLSILNNVNANDWTRVNENMVWLGDGVVGDDLAMSRNGNVIVMSTFTQDSSEETIYSFKKTGNEWIPFGIPISVIDENYQFGETVVLSHDGMIMATTQSYFADADHTVKIFKYTNDWEQIGNDIFGSFVSTSISGDGTVFAVADYNNDPGVVRLFQIIGETYAQLGNNITGGEFLSFGKTIALSKNGKTVIIGSPSDPNGVEVYHLNGNNQWVKLGQSFGTIEQESLGIDVAISDNGDIIAIAGIDTNFHGYISCYKYNGNRWEDFGNKITNNQDTMSPSFKSIDLSLSGDGNHLVYGFIVDSISRAFVGEVYSYSIQNGIWVQNANIVRSPEHDDESSSSDNFGKHVHMSENGSQLVVSDPYSDEFVFVYQRNAFPTSSPTKSPTTSSPTTSSPTITRKDDDITLIAIAGGGGLVVVGIIMFVFYKLKAKKSGIEYSTF